MRAAFTEVLWPVRRPPAFKSIPMMNLKKRRTKFIIALAGNEIKEADLKSKEYMNTIFQLFLGWSADRWRIDSFMIEKLNQF